MAATGTIQTQRVDLSALFKDAWRLARRGAVVAGCSVRLCLGNGLRMAWARARAAVARRAAAQALRERIAINDKLMLDVQAEIDAGWGIFAREPAELYAQLDRLHADGVAFREELAELEAPVTVPQQAQQQQANASQPIWTVVQDYHASAVIRHFVVDGLPVLVHKGGRYPSLVDESGRTTHDAMHVAVWVGSNANVSVYAYDGYERGYSVGRRVYAIEAKSSEAAIEAALARVGEAVAAARTLRVEKAAHEAALKPVFDMHRRLSRTEYEEACVRFGVVPFPEEKVGVKADAIWPHHSVGECTLFLLSEWRSAAREADERARREAALQSAENARVDLIARLRLQPVSRTVTEFVPGHVPDERLVRGALWTVVKRGRSTLVDEDMPSRYGEQLLGHEGSYAREVTFEIRTLPQAI